MLLLSGPTLILLLLPPVNVETPVTSSLPYYLAESLVTPITRHYERGCLGYFYLQSSSSYHKKFIVYSGLQISVLECSIVLLIHMSLSLRSCVCVHMAAGGEQLIIDDPEM